MHKYYNTEVAPSKKVNWCYLDGDNSITQEEHNVACFSRITYDAIPEYVKKIVVSHERSQIPYSDEIIHRWIKELNAFNFPVSVEIKQDEVDFTIELEKYEYKAQVNCALQFIRALYERFIAYLVECYFNRLDANPSATLEEKFAFLQEAHKEITCNYSEFSCYDYPNTNHMVISSGNFDVPLTRAEIFERFKGTEQHVYDPYKSINIERLWRNNVVKEIKHVNE